jgi:hypothetical protein
MSIVTITDTRRLMTERAGGSVEWVVNEFDDGRAYMLTANFGGVGFSAHFTGEQWAEFQEMVGR